MGTPPEGVYRAAGNRPVEDTPGCTASDYDGLPVAGAVVLVDRGTVSIRRQAGSAAERGAVALIVANNEDGDEMGGTLGEKTDVKIPVVSVTKATGERLRAQPGPHHHQAQRRCAQRAHAQRDRPDQDRIHRQRRDGRRAPGQRAGGPGHQRQRLGGGGGAGNRAAAGQLAAGAQRGAVRLLGRRGARLFGSNNYVESLNVDALKDIALYLNFDMVGSPNPGYFTYDGDQSTRAERTTRACRGCRKARRASSARWSPT